MSDPKVVVLAAADAWCDVWQVKVANGNYRAVMRAITQLGQGTLVCVEAERLAERWRDAERWRAVESATEILSAGAGSPLTTDRNWWRASIPGYNGQIYAETLTRLADEIIKAKAREALAAQEVGNG